MSDKVKDIADKVNKLSPEGKAIVKGVLNNLNTQKQSTGSILRQTYAIDATKKEIATQKELIESHIEQKQSWLDYQSAKDDLKRLKLKLDSELNQDGDYNNMMEKLADSKEKLKSEKEIMSDLIVGYRIETGESQIEISDDGDAQQIILKGTLGKKAKYQTNIFNEARS